MQSKKGAFNPGVLIVAIIGIMVVVLVATAILPIVQQSVDETETGGDLENMSTGGKALYNLLPLLLVVVLILAVVGAAIVAGKGK